MFGCIKENLEKGIKNGLYRESLNVDFTTRLYFNSMVSLKDQDLFPLTNFSMNTLMEDFLEYHLRGICTIQGIENLENYIKINQSK